MNDVESYYAYIGWSLKRSGTTRLSLTFGQFLDHCEAEYRSRRIVTDLIGRPIVVPLHTVASDTNGPARTPNKEFISESLLRLCIDYGRLAAAISRSDRYRQLPFESAAKIVQFASETTQFKLYCSDESVPSGFVIWAWLSDYSMNSINGGENIAIDVSEWTEGVMLTFMYYTATNSVIDRVCADIINGIHPSAGDRYLFYANCAQLKVLKFKSSETERIRCLLNNELGAC
jgi:hemolysin-activating ACP:hemolysin acyltransferase